MLGLTAGGTAQGNGFVALAGRALATPRQANDEKRGNGPFSSPGRSASEPFVLWTSCRGSPEQRVLGNTGSFLSLGTQQ